MHSKGTIKKVILSAFMFFVLISDVDDKALAIDISDTLTKLKEVFLSSSSSDEGYNYEPSMIGDDRDYVIKARSKTLVEDNKTGASDDVLVGGEVLHSSVGPVRSSTEAELLYTDYLQVYEVKTGDTIEDVARLYNVSKNTIMWANDIKNKRIRAGDTLLILPVDGVKHKVKKGDTVKSLAKKYKADAGDIVDFNTLDSEVLVVGEELIIPDGEIYFDAPSKPTIKSKPVKIYASAGAGYYVRPIIGGSKTQGIHGKNAVDIGAPIGSKILAAAAGTVQVARNSGYNGGYGKMIIISHSNGTQTVYSHLSSVEVSTGDKVAQGQQVGLSGNTGKSTGPHLHFEIRGAANPF